MDDGIYILVGEQKTGPFRHELFKQYREAGRFPDGTMCWKEGWETWKPIEDLDENEEDKKNELVLMQGHGYRITADDIIIGTEIFPLASIKKAKVEVEQINRTPAFTQVIGSALVVVIICFVLFSPDHSPTNAFIKQILTVSAVVAGVVLLRASFTAFRPDETFVGVHIGNGDERILRIKGKEAKNVVKLVNDLAPKAAAKLVAEAQAVQAAQEQVFFQQQQ